ELLLRVVHDPDVRLVRDVDVDVLDGDGALVEQSLSRRDEDSRRELEDLAAVHLDVPVADRVLDSPRAAAGQREVDPAAAVGAELATEVAAVADLLEHHRTSAVTEENERRAVSPIDDPPQDVAADDELRMGHPR